MWSGDGSGLKLTDGSEDHHHQTSEGDGEKGEAGVDDAEAGGGAA